MYGQFFTQLVSDVSARLGRGLTKADKKVMDVTVNELGRRARRRGTEALVRGMKAEKRYHTDPTFKHAIDVIISVVVPAALGDVPGVDPNDLKHSAQFLIDALVPIKPALPGEDPVMKKGSHAHASWMDEMLHGPQPHYVIDGDHIWQNVAVKPATSVSANEVYAAMKKIEESLKAAKAAAPASGLAGSKTGRFSVKDPHAQSAAEESEQLAELLKMVEGRAKRLAAEQTAKEIGMPLEEAKQKYPSIFAAFKDAEVVKASEQGLPVVKNGDHWEFTYTMDMTD